MLESGQVDLATMQADTRPDAALNAVVSLYFNV
jgi:hypothetical protein